ncbi:hypothetical protein CKAH01_12901 [Colletotrichum kahawae]|uniref:Uncharacterized protein n=1 Tax=Colletotrichum kahawae TaxID=34407 RepID=A0AAE0DBS4_COLKA|nr:hypothetical protein CKAH01_12901 [Colletotrichum kahawae]
MVFWQFLFDASTVQRKRGFTHAVIARLSFQACSALPQNNSPMLQGFPSNCFSSTRSFSTSLALSCSRYSYNVHGR